MQLHNPHPSTGLTLDTSAPVRTVDSPVRGHHPNCRSKFDAAVRQGSSAHYLGTDFLTAGQPKEKRSSIYGDDRRFSKESLDELKEPSQQSTDEVRNDRTRNHRNPPPSSSLHWTSPNSNRFFPAAPAELRVGGPVRIGGEPGARPGREPRTQVETLPRTRLPLEPEHRQLTIRPSGEITLAPTKRSTGQCPAVSGFLCN